MPEAGEHYQAVEKRLCAANPEYFGLDQYDNPSNPAAYYASLGPEIWEQTAGEVDYLVAAGSTGGTISGTSRYLKSKKATVRSLLPDPHGSIFAEYWRSGRLTEPAPFQIEGVGKDSIPAAMDFDTVDMVLRVHDADAFETCDAIAAERGLLVGGSAGANVWAAVQLAGALDAPSTIVAILCDSGHKCAAAPARARGRALRPARAHACAPIRARPPRRRAAQVPVEDLQQGVARQARAAAQDARPRARRDHVPRPGARRAARRRALGARRGEAQPRRGGGRRADRVGLSQEGEVAGGGGYASVNRRGRRIRTRLQSLQVSPALAIARSSLRSAVRSATCK